MLLASASATCPYSNYGKVFDVGFYSFYSLQPVSIPIVEKNFLLQVSILDARPPLF